ncbi:MAG: D-TA family PLP-dependent enzyme [Planctomycetes bacterium]|nr:D-TA family PLP-dependent enzyme [Planctomycetota bacterium]
MPMPPLHLEDLQTPTLVIDLDAVRHNLATMRHYLDGRMDRWRPHVKTCKVTEVLELLLAEGVRHFKVSTTRECEVLLAATKHPIDVLFAMAQHGSNLHRVVELAQKHKKHRFAMLSEDPAHATELRKLALGIFVDLDPGYQRTGIPLHDQRRVQDVIEAAGDSLRGLHCYEGHLTRGSLADRTAEAHAIYHDLVVLARSLPHPGELVTSGTPTFLIALAYEPLGAFLHTVSPGTVVYWDARSQQLGIEGFACAVSVQTRVVSLPSGDRITVDAGSKALDAAVGDPCAFAIGKFHLRALHPSEEHMPMHVERGARPPLGSLLRLVPAHVCPTVNLADSAALVANGTLLRVVPVGARGHETLPPKRAKLLR